MRCRHSKLQRRNRCQQPATAWDGRHVHSLPPPRRLYEENRAAPVKWRSRRRRRRRRRRTRREEEKEQEKGEEEEEEEEEERDLLSAEVARRAVVRNAARGSEGSPANGKSIVRVATHTGSMHRGGSLYTLIPRNHCNTRLSRRCQCRAGTLDVPKVRSC